MPNKVVRARILGYTNSGLPKLSTLPDAACADDLPDDLGARQFTWTHDGKPKLAYAWECCDAICTDAEIAAGDCWKLPSCWTAGDGLGLSKWLRLSAFDTDNCYSVRGLGVTLLYSELTGDWRGTLIGMRGGDLGLTLTCNSAVDPASPAKFTLSWTGCDTGSASSSSLCTDPMLIVFGPVIFDNCCDCFSNSVAGTGTQPVTDQAPQVTFYVSGNCRRVVFARHVHYAYLTGTGTGSTIVPVVAKSRPCVWDQVDDFSCSTMKCPLRATVTNLSACSCMSGEYGLDYLVNEWFEAVTWSGCSPGPPSGTIILTCTDVTGTGTGIAGGVRLTLTLLCGATNTGSATIEIPAADLENLDETFTVNMTDPTISCSGTCTFTWNAMSMDWHLTTDGCSGDVGCACVDALTIPPPADPSIDGQTTTLSCVDSTAVACCIGTVQVRVMRA